MGQTKGNNSRVYRNIYLTEADRHRVAKGILKPLETDELRRQLFFMLLFWDNLVVSDATLNNNEHLRPLLVPSIEKLDASSNALPDFQHFLKKGYIRAAMREGVGFKELLIAQQGPKPAPHLPPLEYANALDELIPEKFRERWSLAIVESYFKTNLIKIFSSEAPLKNIGIPSDASRSIHKLIIDKGDDPINYRELRHLIEHPDEYNQNIVSSVAAKQMGVERFRNVIEKHISDSYRFNVPAALGVESEATRDSLPWWASFGDTSSPTGISIKGSPQQIKERIRPSWIFDEEILGQIPAQAIDEVKSLKSYQDFVSKLGMHGDIRSYRFFAKDFIGTWEAYTQDLEKIFKGEITARKEQEVLKKQKKNNQNFVVSVGRMGLETALSIYFPITTIPFVIFEICIAWKSRKDYETEMKQIDFLGKLTGKPAIKKIPNSRK